MRDSQCNILEGLKGEDFRSCRKTIIECIMATDMAKHKDLVENISSTIKTIKKPNETLTGDDQDLILAYFTHACDLNGSAKDFDTTYKWSNLVRQEFIKQVRPQTTLN